MRVYCAICGKPLVNPQRTTKYCPECAKAMKVKSDRLSSIRKKSKIKMNEMLKRAKEEPQSAENLAYEKRLQSELELDTYYFDLFKSIKKDCFIRMMNEIEREPEIKMSKNISLKYMAVEQK